MMIEPGEKVVIDLNGERFDSVVLTRSQQRKLLASIRQLSTLDENIESIEAVYDIADSIAAMCLPSIDPDRMERLSNKQIFEIASKVLIAQSLDGAAEKKSESPL